ncbi:hypothetical protein [Mycobacterium malmoense]|uniref:RelA/SpoT domain-containing protein n=1 Tax=Mycobacterium malmoense TaxID=1780 RepID=A0ABX3SRB3_MYCMA|nr:hypothetical protein [Mycobacterium malmoense]OIN80668.1 hypothetical protein BMG05_11560 [Mycobacterium malmoense]ORA81733.1 hypothetical protein BST29_13560 [Mycobacterium malmoense]
MDLESRPPWSNNALRRLGAALRDGVDPPIDCPSYADVMLWHFDLAAEVQDQIESGSWSIRSELLATKAGRLTPDLQVSSRPKTQDTLVEKLQRQPSLQLNAVQDLAGVRIDADLLLGEQMSLAREIASYFCADESAIHDLRDGTHAGYRGVHVWLRLPAGRVEIQIRTILQSLWANLFEKLADEVGRGIRYGEPVEPSPGVDVGRIQRAVQSMQEFSAKVAASEADWQQCSEIEDPGRRGVALGTAAMDRAMWVGLVAYAAQKASGEAESSKGEDG